MVECESYSRFLYTLLSQPLVCRLVPLTYPALGNDQICEMIGFALRHFPYWLVMEVMRVSGPGPLQEGGYLLYVLEYLLHDERREPLLQGQLFIGVYPESKPE